MRKMQDRHLKSIDRALTILRMHLGRQPVPKYRAEFERDIRNLTQVRNLVGEYVEAPLFDHILDAACELAV